VTRFLSRIVLDPPTKKGEIRRKKTTGLSMRSMEACRIIDTTLLQSIVDMGTQSTMKRSKKTS
jgi:hypothetical protein